MTDRPGDPPTRVDETADGLRVVARDWMRFARPDRTSPAQRDHEDLFTDVAFPDGRDGPARIRVGTAVPVDGAAGYRLHGANTIVADVPLVERELTDAEVEWCESTMMMCGENQPDTVFEATIPDPEDLRRAVRDDDADALDCLRATVAVGDQRHRIATTMQEDLERAKFRARRLSPKRGYPIDLEPEWRPDDGHNDDRTREHLADMASMRVDAHRVDFETVFDIGYRQFYEARRRLLGHREFEGTWGSHSSRIAFGVLGVDGWAHCRDCSGVAPADQFLHVEMRHGDRRKRLCDECARFRCEQMGDVTEAALARARDEQAKEHGGQSRLAGAWSGDG
jgi:hypothetical protein